MWWPIPAFLSAALALIVERFFGYPKAVQEVIGHPVQWIGWLITRLDKRLNTASASQSEGRLRGVIALAILLACSLVPSLIVAKFLGSLWGGWVVEALVATAFIAQKSMRDHVRAVYKALGTSLPEGRQAVGKIVGRDPARLDESGVAKAALESLAENTSDGIVAPALWYAIFGLPGLVLYKAINTADSMIGHRSDKYLHFGWAAAKLDDLVNIPASRLTGLLFCGAAGWWNNNEAKHAFATMRRDAPKHVSPNAGWPEAALAAGLGIRLGGPRSYSGRAVELPRMGDGRELLTRHDIRVGLRHYRRVLWQLLALMTIGAILTSA
jgi:adenosylcobinamide-phosphate synthase